jgi:hypothetical protein
MPATARKLAAVATLASIAAAAAGTALPLPDREAAPQRAPEQAAPALRLSGDVDGLFPGVVTTLRVRVQNRRPFPVLVRSLAVRVGSGRRGCPARVVRVRPFRGRLAVAARRSRTVALRISMARTAPDACRGARFPLRFSAVARRR